MPSRPTTSPQPADVVQAVLDVPQLLTVAEVASELRVDPYTVRRYVGRGELPAFRVGRELRIDRAALTAYLHGRRA